MSLPKLGLLDDPRERLARVGGIKRRLHARREDERRTLTAARQSGAQNPKLALNPRSKTQACRRRENRSLR